MVAAGSEVTAAQRQVADTCCRPDVVHSPHHRFAAAQDLVDALQREHALVDPVQMDNIGFLELLQPGDVVAGIGNVDLKKMLPGETAPDKDDKPFPEEVPIMHGRWWQLNHSRRGALLVAHQHTGLDTIVV